MMKQIIFIFTLFVSTYSIHAQINADSLINVLETQKTTHRQKILIYSDICYFFVYENPDKTLFYAKEALSLAKKEKDKLAISIFEEYQGRAYEMKGEYTNALEHYSQALDIAIKEKIDHQEAFVYVSIGSLYSRQGKTITSLEYMLKALSIYEMRNDIRDKMQQTLILSNIGGLHRGLENNDRAIYYLEKALTLADELDYTQAKIKNLL